MKILKLLGSLLVFLPLGVFAAPKIGDFAKFPAYQQVQISPKGDYLSARVQLKSGFGLAVIRLSDNKLTALVAMGLDRDLDGYVWVSPTRIVVAPAIYYDGYEEPALTGEIMAVNADGSDQRYLFGYRGESEGETRGSLIHTVNKEDNTWAEINRALPDDPTHVLVNLIDTGDADTTVSRVCKINIETAFKDSCTAAPGPGNFALLADRAGNVRYAISTGENYETLETYVRQPGKEEWTRIAPPAGKKQIRVLPLGLSRDNSKVYLKSDEGDDRYCLVEQTLATNERRSLSCDNVADLGRAIFSFDEKEPIGALYDSDKPRIDLLDTENPDKLTLKQLQASFGGSLVVPTSRTWDGNKLVLQVYSDRDPGGYYLYDVKAKKASPLVAARDGIIPEEMGQRRPVVFKARDGQLVHGYLTIPPGAELKNLPLVVYPHGGPFDTADEWEWDADSQLLATHGFAVLQVNFRGSAGYGASFAGAGAHAWGTTMINDITDGARWTTQQEFVNPKRICIYGVSYGGYAALMSAMREPDLYKCVVDFAGPYDLNLQKKTTDTTKTKVGRNYFKDFVGGTPEQLKADSPRTYIDKLQASIMIVHGEDDLRVPFSNAQALRKDLDARHHPYEWLVKNGEGHGFYSPENKEEFYTKLLAFLDKNIGSGYVPPATDSKTTASVSGQ